MMLLAIALAPVLAIAIYMYRKDKYEPEPKKMLVWAFILGIISIVPTVFVELAAGKLGLHKSATLFDAFIHAFVGVAIIEEGFKYLMVRRFLFTKPYFDEPFDGIMYAVMVSLGFAALENVMYSFQNGASVAIMRAFTAVPAHAAFGVMMGYFLGLAKFNPKSKYFIAAILVPTLFHGAYDFFLIQTYMPELALIGAVLSLIAAIYFSRKALKSHSESSPFKPNV